MKAERWELPDMRVVYREADPVGRVRALLRHVTVWAKRALTFTCCWLFVVLCGAAHPGCVDQNQVRADVTHCLINIIERKPPTMQINKYIPIILLATAACSLDSTSRLKGDSTDVEPADAGVDAASASSWSAPLTAARALHPRQP